MEGDGTNLSLTFNQIATALDFPQYKDTMLDTHHYDVLQRTFLTKPARNKAEHVFYNKTFQCCCFSSLNMKMPLSSDKAPATTEPMLIPLASARLAVLLLHCVLL